MLAMEEHVETLPEDRELIEKLAKLQEMHQQITDLRGLLPERLLRPTRIALENPTGVSPEKLAINMRKAASDGSRDIQRFKKNFQSPEIRELFQKTSNSEIAQGRDSWNTDYQSLANALKSDDNNASVPRTNGNSSTGAPTSENDNEILRQYYGSQSGLKLEPASSSKIYPLKATVSGLSFVISSEEKEGEKVLRLEQESTNPSDLGNEIAAFVNEANKSSSLEVFLSMLASYHDFKFKTCDKCSDVFDDSMSYPIARRRKPVAEKNSKSIEWTVLHRGCT